MEKTEKDLSVIEDHSIHHDNGNEDENDEELLRIYQEAAIYLQEGENNDKFNSHPHSPKDLPAYKLAHSPWFYCLDFTAAIAVLALALFERPAFYSLELPVMVHGAIEIVCLLLLSVDLGICLRWMGWDVLVLRKRTLLKAHRLHRFYPGMLLRAFRGLLNSLGSIQCIGLLGTVHKQSDETVVTAFGEVLIYTESIEGVIIAVMLIEAIVVVVRQTNHFRVTRALRPIFLFHTHYCKGVRRIIRQIIQSLPPILDMVLLMLFLMFIFSILGFHMFSEIPNDKFFQTLDKSFTSLFVLLTSANYPDVMMSAYAVTRIYSAFFILYLFLELFFFMNLLLAVVYDAFSRLEKKKLRALYFHKHEACIHSFQLLTSRTENTQIPLKHFVGMMKCLIPHRTIQEYYFMFKSLNTSKSGMLSLEEFYNVYNAAKLRWKLKSDSSLWSSGFVFPFNKICKVFHWIATQKFFEYGIYVIIAGNFVWILIETIRISSDSQTKHQFGFTTAWICHICTILYALEALIKIFGRGPRSYFSKGWDIFDFTVTVLGMIGLVGEVLDHSFHSLMLLRPFRLLRLFRVKKRYRDVLGTLFVLFNKFMSLAICIIIVYYFYAIIAMEIFLDVDLRDCCKNTSVAANYAFRNTTDPGHYYLNNFDNLFVSWVTLFELTVVNNWFIIMEGYAHAFSQWSRIFFMSFYIVMMVVMNIVVAFVLESFIFRINYRRQMHLEDMEDHHIYKEEINLSGNELEMISVRQNLNNLDVSKPENGETSHIYYGERPQSRDDFSLRMYSDEVKRWAGEFNTHKQEIVDSMEKVRRRCRSRKSRGFRESFRFRQTVRLSGSHRLRKSNSFSESFRFKHAAEVPGYCVSNV